jgi:hypothetical protein
MRISVLPTALTQYFAMIGLNGILNLTCDSASVPKSTVKMGRGVIREMHFNQGLAINGSGSITFSFFERGDYLISKFFNDWKELNFDKLTGEQLPKPQIFINKGVAIDLLDGSDDVMSIYELYGVMCSDSDISPLGSDAGLHKVSATLEYQNFKQVK